VAVVVVTSFSASTMAITTASKTAIATLPDVGIPHLVTCNGRMSAGTTCRKPPPTNTTQHPITLVSIKLSKLLCVCVLSLPAS
jgi:hypothetical protein